MRLCPLFAHATTHFTATRSEKKLNTVHWNKDPRCGSAYGAGDYSVNIVGEVQSSTCSAGLGPADMSCDNGRVFGTTAGGGGPATGAMTSLVAATLGPSSGVAADLVHPGGVLV